MYIDKLNDIENKCNNKYHRSIKMKPIDVNPSICIDFNRGKEKSSKFKVGDNVIISLYKNIFAKGYVLNLSEEIFVIENVKNTVSRTYIVNYINGEEIV